MLMEAETWVAIGFVIFVGLLAYLGVHKTVVQALDRRAAKIKAELDEAKRLKDEALALLAEYRKKAEAQAVADVRSAAADAAVAAAEKILAVETKGQLAADLVARGVEDIRKKLN
jgi:F-type H+-transporting ATPase subunit b